MSRPEGEVPPPDPESAGGPTPTVDGVVEPTPASGGERPGRRDAAPRAVGMHRLDLRTDEPAMTIPDDTPVPLTASVLASVRRAAAARRFPDGAQVPDQSDGWDAWAEGMADTDDRIAALADDLRGRASLGRLLGRRRRPPGRPASK